MQVNSNDPVAMKQPVENDKAIIVNQIVVRNIDRTMKDIATWRNAHIAAERVIWPIRQKLYDTYADVLLDGHLSGIIQKRVSAVLNKKIYFKDKEGKEVEEIEPLLKSRKFKQLRSELFNTKLWGVTGLEFIPGKEFDFVPIPRKHIKPEYKIIAKEQYGFEGFDYSQMPNVMVMGEPHDLGLLVKCAPYAIWKRGGLADYAQFVEIFGQPVRIYEYDAYDSKTKEEVQKVADSAGGAMSILIPKQANFKMEDGKTSNANGDLQVQFIKCLNDELSVIMLGNTETTTSSKGSGYAQSKTHGQQQMQITQDDMEYELQYLNSSQFISILKSYGFPVDGGEFCHEHEADVQALVSRIEVDKELCKIIPIADDYFYGKYDIPKPDNYDELKSKMETAKIQELGNDPKKEPANPKPKQKDKQEVDDDIQNLSADSIFNKIRTRLADFFDPALR